MKKYFLKSKRQFLKTSFILISVALLSVFLMNPLQHIRANESKNLIVKKFDCSTHWALVEQSCSCIGSLCIKVKKYRKYLLCAGVYVQTNEYKTKRSVSNGC
ncbi:hypothetical protein [Aquimarina sp. Aq78]|uniref:hypothetical protein n=1 Tax=Aquimarina sp. Aq78 TaxID=1191889 RepID=UPI000D104C51|nr:hypothetical protein [Aquimarina sp. Aq78]